ncbi:hypothetical protein B296_00044002, partial [Ensete ventricosum]
AAATLAHWQPPCQGATTPTAGVAAHVGDRAGRGRQPLAGALQPAPFVGPTLQSVVPAGDASPCRGHPYGQLTPLAGVVGLPFELAVAAANRPLAGGLGRGLAMAGRPRMRANRG